MYRIFMSGGFCELSVFYVGELRQLADGREDIFQAGPIPVLLDLPRMAPEMEATAMPRDVLEVVIDQTAGVGGKTGIDPQPEIADAAAFDQMFEQGQRRMIEHLNGGRQDARPLIRRQELHRAYDAEPGGIDLGKRAFGIGTKGGAKGYGIFLQQRA